MSERIFELPDDFFNHDAQQGGFYPRAHVGIEIENFGKRQNVLIEGIRGTGKTHILRMLEKYNIDNFEATGVLPVYISLAQANIHASNIEKFRINLYTLIVQRCTETLETFRELIQPDKNLRQKAMNTLKRLFQLEVDSDFDEMFQEIKELADRLLFHIQFENAERIEKQVDTTSSEKHSNFEANASLKIPPIKGSTKKGNNFKDQASSTSEQQLRFVSTQLAQQSAANFLIEFLRQLQVILDLEYTLILLDECSEAPFEYQVEIFRLFKTIRGARPAQMSKETCAFFIGTVYPQGATYYPTRLKDGFSFEPGQDCTMEYLQWDETDTNAYFRFFENMMLFRANDRFGYTGLFPGFSELVFDNYQTFLLIALCSHGVPRRFWELLKRSYDRNTKTISYSMATDSIHEIVNDQILSLNSLTEEDLYLLEQVTTRISNMNSTTRGMNRSDNSTSIPQTIYFTLPLQMRSILNPLVMQGAVHNKSRMRSLGKVSVPKPVFSLDIAVAFSRSVVPIKSYVTSLNSDIPRCAKNSFQQALELREEVLRRILEHEDVIEQLPEEKGIVSSFERGRGGEIWCPNRRKYIGFYWNQVAADHKDSLSKGDKVNFRLREDAFGLQALEVEVYEQAELLVEMGQRVIGYIKKVKRDARYGFIIVLDRGKEAYFSFSEVQQEVWPKLQRGTIVEFELTMGDEGRIAKNIIVIAS